jgi:hypothetical protein
VDRGAARARGYPGLAEDRYRSPFREGGLDRAQLAVDQPQRVELRDHERVVALAEAVKVVDEATEVAVGELAGAAQEARAAARSAPRAEAWLLDGWRLGGLPAVRTPLR